MTDNEKNLIAFYKMLELIMKDPTSRKIFADDFYGGEEE